MNFGHFGREARDAFIYAPAKRIRKLFMMASESKPSRVTRDNYYPGLEYTCGAEQERAQMTLGMAHILSQDFMKKGEIAAEH